MAKRNNTVQKELEQAETIAEAMDLIANAPAVNEVKLDAKERKSEVNMSMEEVEAKGWKNKSQTIRGLAAEGYSTSAIAKFLDIRYQHVRNVLTQILKRPVEVAEPTTDQE